jgi:F-type H+-transporting ATPase subunit b
MPQFDIFSFYSQLFWVFSGFLVLYLFVCFCILPAVATTLKIRNRKLKQSSDSSDFNLLDSVDQNKKNNSAYISHLSNTWNNLSAELSSANVNSTKGKIFVNKTDNFIVIVDSFRQYSLNILNQLSLVLIFK